MCTQAVHTSPERLHTCSTCLVKEKTSEFVVFGQTPKNESKEMLCVTNCGGRILTHINKQIQNIDSWFVTLSHIIINVFASYIFKETVLFALEVTLPTFIKWGTSQLFALFYRCQFHQLIFGVNIFAESVPQWPDQELHLHGRGQSFYEMRFSCCLCCFPLLLFPSQLVSSICVSPLFHREIYIYIVFLLLLFNFCIE